jgi:adenylate cyclase
LVLQEKIIGVFGAVNSSSAKHFGREERALLQAIASQADTAIFEDFEREKIKTMFKRYVDDSVVDKLLKEDPEAFMKGKRRFMSVLFADIRGFTSYSETLSPQELVKTINDYLGDMTDVIMNHKGTLDKFVGDEVMALFGAPIRMKKHATTSVETAIDMQKAMQKLQKKWEKDGKEPLGIGIGINTGYMVAGNIGCEKMSDYTVLGDNVNLGCRICNLAPKDTIYITEKTKRELKKEGSTFKTKKLEPIQVRGKRKKVQLYQVLY